MISFTRVQQLAEQLPGAEVSTSYGTPAIKVRKKLLLRLHQKEDAFVMLLDSVAVQQSLIATDPMSFYITDHYEGYAAVLVRPTVDEETFFELMQQKWRSLANPRELAAYEAARGAGTT